MMMTETLFGGMLVVVLIFFIGRRFGLSAYWSGTLGAALPFLAYLGYTAGAWPEGDVLAVHLVVFMATAGILGVFSSVRQRKEKMHWAPKLIIAFFILLAVINAGLVSIALNGLPDSLAGHVMPNKEQVRIHTVFPGVIPHDPNKMYEAHQKRIEQQRNLGWQVELIGMEKVHSGVKTPVRMVVRDAHGQPVKAERALLGFWRMANSKDDHLLELKSVGDGEFEGEILLVDPGRWIIELGVARGQDVYQVQRPLLVEEPEA